MANLTPNQIKEIHNSKVKSYQDYVTRQQQKGKQAKRERINHVKNLYAEYYKNNKSLPPMPERPGLCVDDETRLKEAEYQVLYGKSYISDKIVKNRIQKKRNLEKRKQENENEFFIFIVGLTVAFLVLF